MQGGMWKGSWLKYIKILFEENESYDGWLLWNTHMPLRPGNNSAIWKSDIKESCCVRMSVYGELQKWRELIGGRWTIWGKTYIIYGEVSKWEDWWRVGWNGQSGEIGLRLPTKDGIHASSGEERGTWHGLTVLSASRGTPRRHWGKMRTVGSSPIIIEDSEGKGIFLYIFFTYFTPHPMADLFIPAPARLLHTQQLCAKTNHSHFHHCL